MKDIKQRAQELIDVTANQIATDEAVLNIDPRMAAAHYEHDLHPADVAQPAFIASSTELEKMIPRCSGKPRQSSNEQGYADGWNACHDAVMAFFSDRGEPIVPQVVQATECQIRDMPNMPSAFEYAWFDATASAYHATPENKRRILYDTPQQAAADCYPECSGDSSSCPENEGHGCCKPNSVQAKALTDERDAFERWILSIGGNRDYLATCEIYGKYKNMNVQNSWDAWQARALLASQPSAQPIATQEPEWINDPHDIEQGMMRNPKYKPKPSVQADVAEVPKGWKLVPLEATEAMIAAFQNSPRGGGVNAAWRCIISAVPAAPTAQPQADGVKP